MKMDYEVRLSESGEYILNIVKAPITLELLMNMSEENVKIQSETEINLLLSDCRNSRNEISVSDNYAFANNEAGIPRLKKNTKVAIIVSEGDDSHYQFETFALNAGSNIKVFTNFKKGERWLLKDE